MAVCRCGLRGNGKCCGKCGDHRPVAARRRRACRLAMAESSAAARSGLAASERDVLLATKLRMPGVAAGPGAAVAALPEASVAELAAPDRGVGGGVAPGRAVAARAG
jgi:hypothetical protein